MVALQGRNTPARNPIRTLGVVACMLAAAALLPACSSGDTPEPAASPSAAAASTDATTAETTALHPVPANSVAVTGTATCDFSLVDGVDPTTDDGPGLLATCQLDMSDPRVSGTEVHDRFRFYKAEGDRYQVWVAEDAVLTNSEGTWRGVAQGVEDAAMGYPIGEVRYAGEGAYEGLVFHYYFADDTNAGARVNGWISSDG